MKQNTVQLSVSLSMVLCLAFLVIPNISALTTNSINADRCLEESAYIYDPVEEEEESNPDESDEEDIDPQEPDGYIWGCKWEDLDGDGIWDSNENPLKDWEIELIDQTTDNVIASTKTDGDGYYDFDNVEAGDYIVKEVQQTDWTQTAPIELSCMITIGQVQIYTGNWDLNDYACIFGNRSGEQPTPTITLSPTPDDRENEGNGSRRSGSGTQRSDRDNKPIATPNDEIDEPEILGTATLTPSATQEILAKTGISLNAIAILGFLNLQFALLASEKIRRNLLNAIAKIA